MAYNYQRHPMDLYGDPSNPLHKPNLRVNNQDEEDAAIEMGYSENPPAIPASVAVAQMTTQPALQASYEALKKELDQKTAEFNIKYAKLELKHNAAVKQVESLSAKHLELQGDYADLTAEHEALLNQKPEPQPDEPPTVDEMLTAQANGEDPFATMEPVAEVEAAPAPKVARARR